MALDTARWPGQVPLVIIPTAYPELTEAKVRALGKIAVVIYANHAVRAAVTAMREVFAAIRKYHPFAVDTSEARLMRRWLER